MSIHHPDPAPSTRPPARRATRRRSVAALAAALALAAVPAAAGSSTAEAAGCAVTWGSLAKTSPTLLPGRITAVRAGQHPCYDRLVVDVTGRAPGYSVRYVSTVYSEGQGAPVPVAGGARLAVVVKRGATTRPAMPSVTGFRTVRQVRWAGSFEGYTTLALGVRARLPFRVFTLYDAATDRSRLVIDVAHTW